MKRTMVMLVTVILLLGLTACSASPHDYSYYDMPIEKTNIGTFGDRLIPRDLAQLERVSSVIVQGTVLDDGETATTGGRLKLTGTISSLKISKVKKGDLEKNAVIKLYEDYYVDGEGKNRTLHLNFNYMPSETGKEYLFFLIPYPGDSGWENTYAAWGVEMGRYPVVSQNLFFRASAEDIPLEELYLEEED